MQRKLLVHFARVDVAATRQDGCASAFMGVRALLVAWLGKVAGDLSLYCTHDTQNFTGIACTCSAFSPEHLHAGLVKVLDSLSATVLYLAVCQQRPGLVN